MIARVLSRKLRQLQGPVFVEVTNSTDAHTVQVVKADLIRFIEGSFLPDEETGYTLYRDSCVIFCKELY